MTVSPSVLDRFSVFLLSGESNVKSTTGASASERLVETFSSCIFDDVEGSGCAMWAAETERVDVRDPEHEEPPDFAVRGERGLCERA